MELFYTSEEDISRGSDITLSADESHHIHKVLRKKEGDLLYLTDGRGGLITGKIAGRDHRQVTVSVTAYEKTAFPGLNTIELGVAIIRPNRMDWLVEKSTELGIMKVVPLLCRYNSYQQIKKNHLEKIAVSAMKQSQQTYLPEISDPQNFREWMEDPDPGIKSSFIASPGEDNTEFTNITSRIEGPCRLAIGPEGGFTEEELEISEKSGFRTLKLGNTILRTETAAIAGLITIKNLLTE